MIGRRLVTFSRAGQRGLSVVEVVFVLLVVALAGAGLYAYLDATKQSLETLKTERPINYARLTADLTTLADIRKQLDVYYAANGRWPESREAVASMLHPTPTFQCAGNDYTYDPASGAVGLVNMDDPGRC